MHLKATLVFLFVIVTLPLTAQFKSIMLGEPGELNEPVGEPAISINPRHPENVIVATRPGKIYYTKDAGLTWAKANAPSSAAVDDAPVVVTDPKGVVYSFHQSAAAGGEQGYVVQRSDDGGATWSSGEPIGLSTKDPRKKWATVDAKGNLFVTWTEFDKYGDTDPACGSRILFSMSKNGKKWSDPRVISQLQGNCLGDGNSAMGAVPAVTYDGKVAIAWSNQGKIFLDRSFNGGDLWLSNDIVVQTQVGGWKLDIPGHGQSNGLPVLMTDKSRSQYRGSLYLAWADQRNGADDTDIWFTRSHNYGDNWTSPMRVNDDGKGKHQYLPWMAVDQETGYFYILYYDRRNHEDHQTDVYLAWSTDGGASFKNRMISETPFSPEEGQTFGESNNLSAHKGIIIPVWTRVDGNKTSVWTTVIKHEDLASVTKSAMGDLD